MVHSLSGSSSVNFWFKRYHLIKLILWISVLVKIDYRYKIVKCDVYNETIYCEFYMYPVQKSAKDVMKFKCHCFHIVVDRLKKCLKSELPDLSNVCSDG